MAGADGAAEGGRRLDEALDLADVGFEIMRQNLRRKHPRASAERIEELLHSWLGQRPGAELGDGPGRARPLPEP